MDREHEGSSPTRSENSGWLLLGSATPSESGPSKPLSRPPAETLTLPEWENKEEVITWFLQLRKALKSIVHVYRYCGAIQKALKIFEANNATNCAHYSSLTQALQILWKRWKDFVNEKTIAIAFPLSSIIYDDFLRPIRWMRTQRKASAKFASKMAELRTSIRLIENELSLSRGLLEDAIVRLLETQDGHETSLFFGPVPGVEISVANLENLSVADVASNDTDSDADQDPDEEMVAQGGFKDWESLYEHGLEPIWTEESGYPGEIPDEIAEYLDSNKQS
jgi:hypothetical protein